MKSMMRQTSAKSRFFIDIKLLYLFKNQINKHRPDCYRPGSINHRASHLEKEKGLVGDEAGGFLEVCWPIFIY